MKKFIAIISVATVLLGSGTAFADTAIGVGGEAGSCTSLSTNAQGYDAFNGCGRKIILHMGPYTNLINPGGKFHLPPVMFGGSIYAVYAN